MTLYYVDPAAGGSNDGTSWTNAWVTWADAIAGTNGTAPAAGDTCYLRGSETISSAVTPSASGTNNSMIKWIGCNASGTPDGTRYVINTSTNAINALDMRGGFLHIENIEITSGVSGAGAGIYGSSAFTSRGNIFINCYVHAMVGQGVTTNLYLDYSNFYRCRFENNSSDGYYGRYNKFISCSFAGNGAIGSRSQSGWNLHLGCVAVDNTTDGFDLYGTSSEMIINSVSDGNGGYGFDSYGALMIGCRSSNNTSGGFRETYTTYQQFIMHCYTDGTISGNDLKVNDVATSTASGTDTDDGYTNLAGNNFTLASGATGEDIEIDIDGTNSHWISAGLRRKEPAGGGGGGGVRNPLAGPIG